MIQRFLEVVTWISVIDFKSLDDAGKANIVAAISQAAAALLAMIALLVSLWIFARQQNISRWQLRVAREAEIIAWSRQCMGTLSEIEEKVRLNSGAPHSLVASDVAVYRGRLSALIDEGRLYFPNKDNIFAGQNRPTAYQGLASTSAGPFG